MNIFDKLVNEALKNQPEFAQLKVVVEKELLHHDIIRVLSANNLLTNLTFIGGTCLRTCYGGIRLSEDLNFTGGGDFNRASLESMSQILIQELNVKYGLQVKVSEPLKDIKNVDTWKVKIQTRPKQKHLPAQRINIDICAVPSYEKRPMLLLNPYNVDMGTSGLIIQAQSREEIYADKLLAFALRPNRIKYRDLWDIAWLHQQGLKPNYNLIPKKLSDRNLAVSHFTSLYRERVGMLQKNEALRSEFNKEMLRFLPSEKVNNSVAKKEFWEFIVYLMNEQYEKLI